MLWETPPGLALRAAKQAVGRVQPAGKSSRLGRERWREAQSRQLPAPLDPALPQAGQTLLHPHSSCTSALVAGEIALLFAQPVPLQPAPLPPPQMEHPASLPPGMGPAPTDSTSAGHRARNQTCHAPTPPAPHPPFCAGETTPAVGSGDAAGADKVAPEPPAPGEIPTASPRADGESEESRGLPSYLLAKQSITEPRSAKLFRTRR